MSTRRRRTPETARSEILEAASKLLSTGGVAAVQVRAVASLVEMTDTGVNHHFGNREGLLDALLRHGGRKVRQAVEGSARATGEGQIDLRQIIDALSHVYSNGYAELAVSLHAAGWRDDGVGILEPIVMALHRRRADPAADIDETRHAVAALHAAIALDPIYGEAFRASAGISSPNTDEPGRTKQWWEHHLARSLGISAQIDPSDH
ncbi:TetR/AcrR family transcriptional regulator [Ilumatobacter sp.]|uniref:TetR/AcrR family transcriptional regulator n=1 Tax=Ilumatobacter sp. TaxID=1967498 RepID=UPI003C5D4EFB